MTTYFLMAYLYPTTSYLKDINLPKFSMKQRELCVGELNKHKAKDPLNKKEHNKIPDNDSITKNIFEKFWFEIILFFYFSKKVF